MLNSRLAPMAALLAALLWTSACDDDGDGTSADSGGDTTGSDGGADAQPDLASDASDSDFAEAACDPSLRPIVFVHGFLGAGDSWVNQVQRFASNGYCLDRLRVFDWNTLDNGADHAAELDTFIVATLAATGAEQVDLAGHSAGGRLGYEYLADPARAARVAHYVHVASFLEEAPAGPTDEPVPTLNIWSEDDTVVEERGDIPGATNVRLTGVDHLAVATVADSFDPMYRHFNGGEAPATTSILPDAAILLSGKALSLGENVPAAGATVDVWVLDPATGEREGSTPAGTFEVAADGAWGPFEGAPETHYELRVQGAGEGDRPLHYYREPFVRANPLVYLRVLPAANSVAGLLFAQVPFDDDHAVLVTFIANQALIETRDSLTVDGTEIATSDFASADQTTIAIFYYDGNENGQSDFTPISTFAALPFPFLAGVDLLLDASEPRPIEVVFNGRTIRARNWPSGSEGATIVVLD